MRVAKFMLFLVLLQTCVVLVPAVPAFLVTLGISVVTMIIKQGVDALFKYGLSVAKKSQEQKLQEIAKKAAERNKLSDEETENVIKGILMREIVEKIYHVDYNCTWNVRMSEVEIAFRFDYKEGAKLGVPKSDLLGQYDMPMLS